MMRNLASQGASRWRRPGLTLGLALAFAVLAPFLSPLPALHPIADVQAKDGEDGGSHGGDDGGHGGGGSGSGSHGGSDDSGDADTGSASDDSGHGGSSGSGGGSDSADAPEPGDIGSNDDDLSDDDRSGQGSGGDDEDRSGPDDGDGSGDDDGHGGHGGRGESEEGDDRGGESHSGHGGTSGPGAGGGHGGGAAHGRDAGRGSTGGHEGGRDFEPDVVLAADLGQGALEQAIRLGFHVAGHTDLPALGLTVTRLEVPGGLDATAARDELAAAAPGLLVDLNHLFDVAQSGTCTGVRCFGRVLIGWGDAPGCEPAPVTIGMIDTAVDPRAPALAGRAITRRRFATSAETPAESDHGTAVAAELIGEAAGDFPGLLPNATLLAADVFEADATGRLETSTERLVAALEWLAQQHPVVINASLSGPSSPLLGEAVKRLAARGVPLVAAAGNDGPDAPPRYPAAFPEVIAVTAVDRFMKVYPRANRGPYVDVAAPGVGIWTTTPQGAGEFRDGTSFASPYVTAQVARLLARDPSLSGDALVEALGQGAVDLGDPGPDAVYGRGLARAAGCAVAP